MRIKTLYSSCTGEDKSGSMKARSRPYCYKTTDDRTDLRKREDSQDKREHKNIAYGVRVRKGEGEGEGEGKGEGKGKGIASMQTDKAQNGRTETSKMSPCL